MFLNENHLQKHTESVTVQHLHDHVVCYPSVEVWRHISRVKEKTKYEQLNSEKTYHGYTAQDLQRNFERVKNLFKVFEYYKQYRLCLNNLNFRIKNL